MKLLDLSYGCPDRQDFPSLILSTDSSLNLNGRPVFLPETSERWCCRVSTAYRLNRLGKTIGERFASRYYDSMTFAARLVPIDLAEKMERDGQPLSPFVTAFDGAVTIGQWIDPGSSGIVQVSSSTGDVTVTMPPPTIDRAIAMLSRHFILKTGDIIIPGQPIAEFPVTVDSHVRIFLGDNAILTFKIK